MTAVTGETPHVVKISTYHERVKIIDKAALDNFSQLQYKKVIDKVFTPLNAGFAINNIYIGVKIIKPDGKEVVLNTGEEIVANNDTKLPVAGLETGDILDYYIGTIEILEKPDGDTYSDNDKIILLADEYPIVYFNINYQFGKKINIKETDANEAPAFEVSYNDAGDQLMNLTVRDLPKFQSRLWTSPLREYPYIEIGSSYTAGMFDPGKKLDQLAPIDRSKALFQNGFIEYQNFDIAEKRLKDYFISNQALKDAPPDSVMRVLYNEWKYLTFFNYSGKDLDNVDAMNYRKANSQAATIIMSEILTEMEVDHDVLMVASRDGNSLDNVYTRDGFETMIRINGGETPLYMAFDDIVTHFNEIPTRFQGEKTMVIHGTRKSPTKYIFDDYGDDALPAIPADKNSHEENLQVSLLPADMQKLKVDRVVKETGSLRHDDQKLLIPVQDVDNTYTKPINTDPLEKRIANARGAKNTAADNIAALNKQHDEISKNFTDEIKKSFEQDPEQVANCKITSYGLENLSTVFQFSSSFVLNNLVEKSGNNYTIDAGKLTGAFLKLSDKDKTRDKDIYMPSSRSFKYTIAIAIPPGYSAKGMEAMNHKKESATGSFSSTATVNGNTLTITVTQVYTNNFEKAEDWSKLKDLIQTASDFNDQKIVLEKKG